MTADIDDIETTAPTAGSVEKLAISPNGQFVAGYTSEGKLKVWVSDFSKVLSEFATESKKTPLQLEWCGNDSVVLLWEVSPCKFHVCTCAVLSDINHVRKPVSWCKYEVLHHTSKMCR